MIRASPAAAPAPWRSAAARLQAGGQDGVALVGATLIDGSGGPALPDAASSCAVAESSRWANEATFSSPKDSRGRCLRAMDHPGTDRRPRPSGARPQPGPRRAFSPGVSPPSATRTVASPLSRRCGRSRRAAAAAGPGVYAAGAMIDGLPATYPDAIGVNSESEARKGVDRLVSAGADFIKVYTRIDPPLLRAIVDEAKAFNLRVTGHLGMTDAVTAAKAGIASIEHLTGVPRPRRPSPRLCSPPTTAASSPGGPPSSGAGPDLDSAALTRVAQRLAEARSPSFRPWCCTRR